MLGAIYNFFRNIKNVIVYIIQIAFLLSILSNVVSPNTTIIIPPFGLLFIPLFIANVIILIINKKKNKLITFISFALIVFSFQYIQNTISFSTQKEKKGLKVMSWNVKNFDLYNWSKNIETKQKMFQLIDSINPDVLCCQEFFTNRDQHDNIKALHNLGYEHHSFIPSYSQKSKQNQWGLAIFSKYPLSNAKRISLNPKKSAMNQSMKAEVKFNKKTYTIVNAHFQSIHLDYKDLEYIEDLKKEWKLISYPKSRSVLYKITSAYKQRTKQLELLLRNIKRLDAKNIILCCDLNDVPNSFAYNTLQKSLKDAFKVKGSGISNTVNIGLPLYRIDYIFCSKERSVHHYERIQNNLSDHNIVTAHID